MLNKSEKIEIIKVSLILFLITAISAALLAVINSVTSPIIEKNEIIKQNAAMKIVLEDADSFGEENLRNDKMDKIVTAVYNSNNNAGYVVIASPSGYGGAINLAVGISEEGKVKGVNVISQTETAGLGAKCTKKEFLEQYKGKTKGITVSKANAKDNQINAISSATITSKAVTKGVNAAIEAVNILKGDE